MYAAFLCFATCEGEAFVGWAGISGEHSSPLRVGALLAQTKPPSGREGDRLRWKEPACMKKFTPVFKRCAFPQLRGLPQSASPPAPSRREPLVSWSRTAGEHSSPLRVGGLWGCWSRIAGEQCSPLQYRRNVGRGWRAIRQTRAFAVNLPLRVCALPLRVCVLWGCWSGMAGE